MKEKMDVLRLMNGINDTFGSLFLSSWMGNLTVNVQEYQAMYLVVVATLFTLVFGFVLLFVRKWKNKEFLPEVKEFVGVGSARPRFRKRDKVLFYGRKMLRKVKSISGQVHGGQGKKRRMVMKFARRLLQLKKDTTPMQLKVLEPPAEYLQEDISSDDQRVPPDALYMLQSIRVFGHFEKPIFLKLCKHTEILNIPAGSYLFRVGKYIEEISETYFELTHNACLCQGTNTQSETYSELTQTHNAHLCQGINTQRDDDKNVYVVQNGKVNVYITGCDGANISLKVVKTGESITSLLSFTDVLTGHPQPYKTVAARAVEDSVIVRLPMSAFHEVFQEFPEIFIRVMQVIMVRLQRVTFTALHQYLGLSAELVNPGVPRKKVSPYSSGSPVKTKNKEFFSSTKDEQGSNSGSGATPDNVPGTPTEQPSLTHRRSRSGLDIKFPVSPQPDMLPEYDPHNSSPQTPDLQANLGSSKRRSTTLTDGMDEQTLIDLAREAFVRELGLEDDTILQGGRVEIREVPTGTYLMKEESNKDVALVYLISGLLQVSQKMTDNHEEVSMFSAHPGEIVGGLAVLTGEPSFFTIRAKHYSRIALLSKNTFYKVFLKHYLLGGFTFPDNVLWYCILSTVTLTGLGKSSVVEKRLVWAMSCSRLDKSLQVYKFQVLLDTWQYIEGLACLDLVSLFVKRRALLGTELADVSKHLKDIDDGAPISDIAFLCQGVEQGSQQNRGVFEYVRQSMVWCRQACKGDNLNTSCNIMREHPRVVLHVAHTVVRRLSPFVRQVDFALDWVFLESGRAVYRQGDESDCTFIVLSGRLRSVITHGNGKKELVGEYGKGDLVGIVEMVTQTPRSTTVMAVRDSELAKLPEGLFNAIKLRFPIVVTRLINLLGHRILGSWKKPSVSRAIDTRPSQNNFSTVAIVPISDDVPLTAFTYELYHSLCVCGATLRLTSDVIRKSLGSSILDTNNEYRLTSWLAQQEDQHGIVLYQCDHNLTAWTQRCVRQADCILIVGLADKEPHIGKIEKEVERLAIRTQKELVLLHREGADRPKNTVAWLNNRTWVSSHHHIQCSKRMFSRRSQYRVNELYNKVLMSEPNIHSDFSRMARWLSGTSVGLVLGGGGARGAAHVGMIKAVLVRLNILFDRL
uniref:lysophospholipase n=2 Tax=Timema TaxID=61471 RepID=A0A7R9NYD6_9NEOP|nr:unnamed protein product [Timema tahoe]